jgi:hypothetical protein
MDNTTVRLISSLEIFFSMTAVLLIYRSNSVRKFGYLAAFLAVRILSSLVNVSVVYSERAHLLDVNKAYLIYFSSYWLSFALESILSLMMVYSIFKLAMVPLKGLQTLGILVFRWAAAISAAVAVAMAFEHHGSGRDFLVSLVTQLQQTSSILTLCLLLFVCFAIRPMGLSYRSRIFGISFGLGLLATTSLASAAWMTNMDSSTVVNIIDGTITCLTMLTWSVYFALPEPKRRIIVLPTTSPFLRWNQISMALGDAPGDVAIGGVPPEVFAPAELEVMRRASQKIAQTEALHSASMEPAAFHSLSA